MTRRRRRNDGSALDAALEAMDAEQLRGLLRSLLPWLDGQSRARLENEAVDRAARAPGGWAPTTPSEGRAEAIEAFAARATRACQADPGDVDAYLREGTHAFLARDYAVALRIFRALLIPINQGAIDLGQHEMVDEVLGVDVDACAKQYVCATYLTTPLQDRPRAVHSAVQDTWWVGLFFQPLRELEQIAIEPLPDFDEFVASWRALVEERVDSMETTDKDWHEGHWLREVVSRMEGPAGLAGIARATRRVNDLAAWCRAHRDTGDWVATRAAYEEAAELVDDRASLRGDFLDGAALAAQELGSKDLDAALQRAWREAPTLTRLRRWLGRCASRSKLMRRAGAALKDASADAARQRALLHLLRGELEHAATLLADAPGLGWSDAEHPGHLVFPVFVGLLREQAFAIELPPTYREAGTLLVEDGPQLRTPPIDALLDLAELRAPMKSALRSTMIEAMRTAAAKRIQAVTAHKRRRQYGHAAMLATWCAQADGSAEGDAWLRELVSDYRRYPALQRELVAARG